MMMDDNAIIAVAVAATTIVAIRHYIIHRRRSCSSSWHESAFLETHSRARSTKALVGSVLHCRMILETSWEWEYIHEGMET